MSGTLLSLLLAFALLAANAFFVAAEFALVKSKSVRIDALAQEARMGAKLSQTMQRNIEPYLACCQLGITMASLGLGWVGEPTVAAILLPLLEPLHFPDSAVHFAAFLIGFLVFSSLHIVVGEQVPKTLAIREPEPVALWIAWPLEITFMALWPLNWLLNAASRTILRMLGVREGTHQDILTDVEIDTLVEVSAEHGKLPARQAEYIHNVFRFGELEVADVMVHRSRMTAFDADLPKQQLIDAMLSVTFTRIPLWRGKQDNFVGVIHAKDLLRALIRAGGDTDEIDLEAIIQKPIFVPETTSVQTQLNSFLRTKAHFALVVDEYGEVEGLITLEDILEEIVGDISDEHDVVMVGARKQADGSYLIDGSLAVRDLNRALDWTLPEEDATTIAGLVMHEAKLIPDLGQTFTFHGYRFKITRKDHNRITEMRVIKQPA